MLATKLFVMQQLLFNMFQQMEPRRNSKYVQPMKVTPVIYVPYVHGWPTVQILRMQISKDQRLVCNMWVCFTITFSLRGLMQYNMCGASDPGCCGKVVTS